MTTEVEAPQEAFGDYGKRAMAATSVGETHDDEA
eukprot:SAG31_NODE_4781_length_2958_cov_1.822665_3_plen_34_part_00